MPLDPVEPLGESGVGRRPDRLAIGRRHFVNRVLHRSRMIPGPSPSAASQSAIISAAIRASVIGPSSPGRRRPSMLSCKRSRTRDHAASAWRGIRIRSGKSVMRQSPMHGTIMSYYWGGVKRPIQAAMLPPSSLRLREVDSRGQVALGADVPDVRRGLAAFKIERGAHPYEIIQRPVTAFTR